MASVWSLGLTEWKKRLLKVVLWPPQAHHGTRMPSYTRTYTQTTATLKRTLCPWEQVVEVPTEATGSWKISPGEKAQSLAEFQRTASTSAANSRWVHGSLLFDVTLVCSLNWITPIASVGCWNFLVWWYLAICLLFLTICYLLFILNKSTIQNQYQGFPRSFFGPYRTVF